jgi:two-component system, NtrC family, response regulator PilR
MSPASTQTNVAAPDGDRPSNHSKVRILIVDDEPSMREMLRIVLRRDGYDVQLADSGREAITQLRQNNFDLLLSDIKMPDVSGVDVLRVAKEINRDVVAFMMTAYASTSTAVEAMRLGAVDYFTKPFSMDELRLKIRQHLESHRLKQENVLLKKALKTRYEFSNIIGRSEPMLEVFRMVETIAKTTSTVLITGESGTGKDLVARAIHYNSLRRERPFVALNCGGVPETLLESELFGHMRGAFTGADANKKGLIEVAEGGTVFLDEIGEMTTTMQIKLLRVLQDRRFRRLGGTEEVQADIRVIAATNQDLEKAVASGRFREDLFYRINVIRMHLAPLRERKDDIPLLAEHFLSKYAEQMKKPVRSVAQASLPLLQMYGWPGNVRELENVIERAVALEQTPAILPDSLPPQVRTPAATMKADADPGSRPSTASERPELLEGRIPESGARLPDPGLMLPDLGEGFDLEARGEDFYRHYIALALERAGGVQVKAAEMLGMSFRSFRYYAKKFNIR